MQSSIDFIDELEVQYHFYKTILIDRNEGAIKFKKILSYKSYIYLIQNTFKTRELKIGFEA